MAALAAQCRLDTQQIARPGGRGEPYTAGASRKRGETGSKVQPEKKEQLAYCLALTHLIKIPSRTRATTELKGKVRQWSN